ncbi:MAG: hypothetical protein ABFR95_06720 [Actinomycetota bacterium]
MLALVFAGLFLALPADVSGEIGAPGDGLMLSPTPVVRSTVQLPRSSAPARPIGLGAVAGIGALTGAGVLMQARRRRDDEPFYVVVHGNGGSPEDFAVLLDQLGVTPDRVAAFDYTVVGAGVDSTEASRTASTERAAEALDKLIRELAANHSNIYSLHHSRGGAVGVTMIGALDEGSRPPIDGYSGAALLDPAISGGAIGWLQRAGGISSWLPDNGGFNVERCTDGACRDVRDNLGEASGVEVIAIRNLDAEVTNFWDRPEGLRVYDLVNDGGMPARFWAPLSPLFALMRVGTAHGSVLEHRAVADCVAAEVSEPGSCVWDDSDDRAPVWSGGGGGSGTIEISMR